MRHLIALAFVFLSTLASAQDPSCRPHDEMAFFLAEGWGESLQSIGIDGAGAIVEVFASPETGSWTLVLSKPGDLSCIVASGSDWEAVNAPSGAPT